MRAAVFQLLDKYRGNANNKEADERRARPSNRENERGRNRWRVENEVGDGGEGVCVGGKTGKYVEGGGSIDAPNPFGRHPDPINLVYWHINFFLTVIISYLVPYIFISRKNA